MYGLGETKWEENNGLIFYSSISSSAFAYRMGIWNSDRGDKTPGVKLHTSDGTRSLHGFGLVLFRSSGLY